jgi:hypothetical protein
VEEEITTAARTEVASEPDHTATLAEERTTDGARLQRLAFAHFSVTTRTELHGVLFGRRHVGQYTPARSAVSFYQSKLVPTLTNLDTPP